MEVRRFRRERRGGWGAQALDGRLVREAPRTGEGGETGESAPLEEQAQIHFARAKESLP